MAYLKEKGIISSYEDYLRLPYGVAEDARMLAEGEALRQQRQDNTGGRRGVKR